MPFSPPTFSSLASLSIADLTKATSALAVCAEPATGEVWFAPGSISSGQSSLDLETALHKVRRTSGALYRFSFPPKTNPQAVQEAFDAGRLRTPDRAYPRKNYANSHVLYVGRSLGLKRRVQEHLGLGSPRTYALNLLHWAEPLALPIRLEFAIYDASVSDSTFGHLEDALWDHSEPMFGRRGSR